MGKQEILRESIRARNYFSINLDDTMSEEIINTKGALSSKIVDAVQEELNFIRDYKIEEMVEEEYIGNLKQIMRRQVTKISEMLDEVTSVLIHQIENKNENELESLFTMLTNEIVRTQSSRFIENLNEEFMETMRSSIIRNYELATIIGENRLYDAASDIRSNMRGVLNYYSEGLTEILQNTLYSKLEYYRMEVMQSIKTYKQEASREKERAQEKAIPRVNAQTKDTENIKLIASFANITFEPIFDGVKVVDNKTGTSSILYKQEDGTLVSENNEIKMSYIDGKTTIINKDQIFTFNGKCFAMGTIDNPEQIKIEKVNKNYQISYGGEIITDPIKRGFIFNSIKKKYPVFYERTMRNSKFARMQAESEAKDKESQEIIQDENGIFHINPLHREKYIEKMHILGLKVIENEQGVSLVNQKGESIPITNTGYAFTSSDKKSYVYSELYIISANKMNDPIIKYNTPSYSFFCSLDYRTMNLFADNNHYRMKLNDDGTTEFSIIKNGQAISNPELVSQVFEHYVPNACYKADDVHDKIIEEIKQKENQIKTQEMLTELENTTTKEPEVKVSTPTIETKANEPAEEQKQEITAMLDELNDKKTNVAEQKGVSEKIQEEIATLIQNPKVQRYIALLQIKAKQMADLAMQQQGIMKK